MPESCSEVSFAKMRFKERSGGLLTSPERGSRPPGNIYFTTNRTCPYFPIISILAQDALKKTP